MSYFGQCAESGSGVSPLNEQSRDGSATMLNGATKAEEEDEDERSKRSGGFQPPSCRGQECPRSVRYDHFLYKLEVAGKPSARRAAKKR